jgi:hypothetical protein
LFPAVDQISLIARWANRDFVSDTGASEQLMAKALNGTPPMLDLTITAGRSREDEFKGYRFLFQRLRHSR